MRAILNAWFLLGLGGFSLFGSTAFGDAWSDADTLFARRGEGRATIQQARAAYEQIATSATGAELSRAVVQISKLDLFEGEMSLPKSEKRERAAIFGRCWKDSVTRISPATHGENIQYYYWRGVCLAYWGEAVGPLLALPYVALLLDLVDKGRSIDARYEGGGMHRLHAGIAVDKQGQPLGTYDPAAALASADLATQQEAYPGDPNPGWNWFDNWRAKAVCLMELGRNDEAKTLLLEKKAEIEELEEAGELPVGREPETRWNYRLILEHIATLGG